MNALMIFELVKNHAPKAGWPVAFLFIFLWWTKVTPCPEVVPVAQKQEAKASVRLQVVYKDRIVEVPGEAGKPLPCPDIIVDADSGSVVESAPVASASKPKIKLNKLFLGAGYVDGALAQAGYGYGPWRAYGLIGQNRYGGGLTLDVWEW